ncbi:MAG: LuxR family transcriptional regulator [Pseudoxanthomonas sp.]
MKKSLAMAFFALLSVVPPAFAAPATPSPLSGRWVLDVDSLAMPAEMRPKSVSLQFGEMPDGKWNTQVEIIDQGGKRMDAQSTLALDGMPAKASGTYWVDVVAATMPAPSVLVMQFVYEKVPRSTRIYTVSADGKVLTETETYFKDDATPMTRVARFDRIVE